MGGGFPSNAIVYIEAIAQHWTHKQMKQWASTLTSLRDLIQ